MSVEIFRILKVSRSILPSPGVYSQRDLEPVPLGASNSCRDYYTPPPRMATHKQIPAREIEFHVWVAFSKYPVSGHEPSCLHDFDVESLRKIHHKAGMEIYLLYVQPFDGSEEHRQEDVVVYADSQTTILSSREKKQLLEIT